MGHEIEKKYRLTREQNESLRRRLSEVGATCRDEEFEENTIYTGNNLNSKSCVLRLRRVGGRAILTYKERFASTATIKHQREDETGVEDAEALAGILDALGYKAALIYEKRRVTWHIVDVEVTVDELPFGLFVEIEGEEEQIGKAERMLDLSDVVGVHETYPELTLKHGTKQGEIIVARFLKTSR